MNGPRSRLFLVFAVVLVCSLAAHPPAWAQGADSWSFLITPQMWASHIEDNGLVGPAAFPLQIFGIPGFTGARPDAFVTGTTRAVDTLDPQWGLQLAAQKGRWTLAGSFQYATFETRTDVFYNQTNVVPCCFETFNIVFPGDRVAQEFVNTTRMDMDFAASYLFPDVVQNRLD